MSDLVVRCSSISRLMARPDNADLDPTYLTDELRAILARTKRSDEEKSIIEEAQRNSLSAGGKTHVRELLREAVYGYEPQELSTRPIMKGRQMEQHAIEMLARLTGRPLRKNTERRTNGLISGECDIFDEELRHGRDIKLPYSMETMPIVLDDCRDTSYFWQMQGYEILWDAESWSVDYLLVDTPEELIGFESPAVHLVGHIHERRRWTSWEVPRDRSLERLIMDKVMAARRYYRAMLNEYDRTHQVTEPVVAVPAAPGPKSNRHTAVGPTDLPDLFSGR